MYANSLKYLFIHFMNWERNGNFKFLEQSRVKVTACDLGVQ